MSYLSNFIIINQLSKKF